jgi:hypothetical protein
MTSSTNVDDASDYSFLANDRDSVTMLNGDVLYITGSGSRRPLNHRPPCFDMTYRGSFGSGAPPVVLVWRSTDGGQTFSFVPESTRRTSPTKHRACRSFLGDHLARALPISRSSPSASLTVSSLR